MSSKKSQAAVRRILHVIDAAYESGEGRLSEALPLGAREDSLADFIANEITDCLCGAAIENMPAEAIRALERAADQLDSVIQALYNHQATVASGE